MKYVIYTRVSTKKQGASGLGLEAQEEAVKNYIKAHPGTVVATFKEVESGKNNNRIEIHKAIDVCRKTGATLLIAKLDRLSRNASFIFALRDSGIQLQAIDLPELSTLTLSIFAGMAQYERELISKRTKDALQVLKSKGKKLGNPDKLALPANKDKAKEARAKTASAKAQANPNNVNAFNLISTMREAGSKWAEIRDRLKQLNIPTSSGSTDWQIVQVQRLFKQFHKPGSDNH